MFEHVIGSGIDAFGWILFALAAAGLAYCAATLVALRFFFLGPGIPPAVRTEAVTLLKPLCGAEPRLEANLQTFLEHRHQGLVQIVWGYATANDGAAAAADALTERFPFLDLITSVSSRRHGPSGKVSNLINLYEQAKHPIVIVSDSDMSVGPEYLSRVLDALDGEQVGAVSLLYRGRGDVGFWSTLSAAGISYQFLPGAVFGVWSGLAAPCMGSTIAMRREVLERIGRFDAFRDQLADDYAIGQAIRRAGLKVAVPPYVIIHGCSERTWLEVWRQEVRWGTTVRGVVPLSYAGSVITHPLPLAIFGTLFTQHYDVGFAIAGAALALRTMQAIAVDRHSGAKTASLWLLPLRDCLSFAVFVASLFARRVDWRGTRHHVKARGQLSTDQELQA